MRKSRLQELIERFNTWSQAKFYLEHNHVEVTDYLNEHNLYQKQLTEAELILKNHLGVFSSWKEDYCLVINFPLMIL